MNDSAHHPDAPPGADAAPPPATPAAAAPPPAPPAAGTRRRNLKILAGLVAVCAVGYAAYWYWDARYFESTDDCYVDGDVVQVTAEIPGTVIQLGADDTQSVARGQPLLELDPADAEVAVSNAEANLARAVRAVRALFAQADQLRAEIRDREVDLRQAEQDHDRRTGLLSGGAISSEEFQHTEDRVTELRASLTAAQEQLNETTAQIDGTTIPTHPQVMAAIAAVRDASLALRRTRVTAPVSGVVAQRSVQVGQQVAAGTPLMGIVPLNAVWVDANFKEVQLRNMRVGQPVKLRADMYGGSVVYHGKLVGLSAGSGTAFALLPAQNASGNWIKIVQRLPVRIALDPDELRAHPLRIGLSVTADVDIRDTSGPLVSKQVRLIPIPSQASLAADPEEDARIAQIIKDNLGLPKDASKVVASLDSLAIDAAVPQTASSMGIPRSVTLLALALATFMQVLDTTIANVSIPTIAGYLGVSSDQGTWIITSFAVANGVSVPLTGWLMRRFGVVPTFVTSVLLFTVASFLCGISTNMTELILFRVLQGGVSGPIIPGSQALLLTLFPESRKGTALAIWSMTTLVAPICGPILGGYISDNYAWGWIFLINVPVGIFSAWVCQRSLQRHDRPVHNLKIDGVGLALLVVWVGSLQVMLDQGKDMDWFNSNVIIGLCIVTVVCLAAWIIWELSEEHPIVDLSLFKSANFTLGTVALCLAYGLFFGNVVLMPLWLQLELNYTATWAGIVTAPSGITALLVAPFVGKFIGRYDARLFATASFAVFALSYFMRAAYPPDASMWVFAVPTLVQGFAMGTFFIALLTITFDGLPAEKLPAASGLNNFLRITASGFATSLTTTFWDRREALHQSRLVESLSAFSPALRHGLHNIMSLGLSHRSADAAVLKGVVGQAYLLSSLDLFYLFGWTVLLLIPLCWIVRRPAGGGAVVGGE